MLIVKSLGETFVLIKKWELLLVEKVNNNNNNFRITGLVNDIFKNKLDHSR